MMIGSSDSSTVYKGEEQPMSVQSIRTGRKGIRSSHVCAKNMLWPTGNQFKPCLFNKFVLAEMESGIYDRSNFLVIR